MKLITYLTAVAGFLALTAPLAAQTTISINSPASGSTVDPGQDLVVNVTVTGAVAGIESIYVYGSDGVGIDGTTFPAFSYVNSDTRNYTCSIPSHGLSAGQSLTITAAATFYADSPIQTSINVTVSGTVVPPPANDAFAVPTVISGGTGSTSGSTENATKETGEPSHAGYSGGRSVWFQWTAPAGSLATFDTIGSNFDTLLAVYTGNTVNGLTPIASDDQSGGLNTSLLSFTPTAGQTYQIAIDGWSGAFGNYNLNWEQEPATSAPNWAFYE